MKINYNIALIEKILNDLTLLTGVSFSFLDNQKKCVFSTSPTNDFCSCLKQGKPIIEKRCTLADEKLLEKCEKSLCLESSQCHAKLYDAAMALVKQKVICGYIIFGRVRSKDSPPNPFFQDENGKLAELYKKVPYYSKEQLQSLYDLMSHIFFEKAISIDRLPLLEEAEIYVKENLSKDLSVKMFCKALNVNKNQLYKVFDDFHKKSINEYVTEMRIEEAKRLLSTEKIPISEVAERVGVFNYSYFFRLFKRKTGLTPKQYIKEKNNA